MTVVQIPKWQDDVFTEKTLSSALRAAIGVVGSPHDVAIVVFVGLAGLVLSVASTCVWEVTATADVTAKIVQGWSVVAAGFASAILGFLIAGFSIFAAMTDKTLFHGLAQIKSNGREISDFKFIFYNFLYVFIQYLLYLAVTLAVCFLFVPQSPLWFVASVVSVTFPSAVAFSALAFAVLFGTYSLYVLLLLRSFIWSMYQALLIAIFADA
jgi:hypothetical protein